MEGRKIKLSAAKARVILGLVRHSKRVIDETNEAIEELLEVWGAGFDNPTFHARGDGTVYVVEMGEEPEGEGPDDG